MAVLSVIRNTIRYVIDTLHYYFWGLLWPTGIYCASITYEMYGDYNHLLEKAHPYPFGKALYEWSNFIQVPITIPFVLLLAPIFYLVMDRILSIINRIEAIFMQYLDCNIPGFLAFLTKTIYVICFIVPLLIVSMFASFYAIALPCLAVDFLY